MFCMIHVVKNIYVKFLYESFMLTKTGLCKSQPEDEESKYISFYVNFLVLQK